MHYQTHIYSHIYSLRFSLLLMLRFSKYALYILRTSVSTAAKTLSLFIILCIFLITYFLTFRTPLHKELPIPPYFIIHPLSKLFIYHFYFPTSTYFVLPYIFLSLSRPHHSLLTHSTTPYFYFLTASNISSFLNSLLAFLLPTFTHLHLVHLVQT